jgi:CheY-like chemotaxis protein
VPPRTGGGALGCRRSANCPQRVNTLSGHGKGAVDRYSEMILPSTPIQLDRNLSCFDCLRDSCGHLLGCLQSRDQSEGDEWGEHNPGDHRRSREVARIFSSHLRVGRVVSAVIIDLENRMPDIGRANAKNERGRPAGSLVSKRFDIPIVFIMAHADEAIKARALNAGAIGFLRKPLDLQGLADCLHVALARGSADEGHMLAFKWITRNVITVSTCSIWNFDPYKTLIRITTASRPERPDIKLSDSCYRPAWN